MISAIIAILTGIITGHGWLSALEAFEKPPRNRRAKRYGAIAVGLFLLAAGLLLSAAIVDAFKDRKTSELVGETGLIILEISVICALRYNSVNRVSDDAPQSDAA
jgi:hypothetical protein